MLCRNIRYITRTVFCESQTLIKMSRLCLISKSNFCANTSKDDLQKHTTQPENKSIREKPKRVSIYSVFMKSVYPKIKEENPGQTFIENARIGRELWVDSDEEYKQEIIEKYKEKREEYLKELKDYYENLTPEMILRDAKKQEIKRERDRKKEQVILGMPTDKKMSTGMNVFMSQKLQRKAGEEVTHKQHLSEISHGPAHLKSHQEKYKDIASQWTALSEEEKQDYRDLKHEQNTKHETAMIQWEREMIARGRFDLIRKTTFNKLRNREFEDIFTEQEIQTMQTQMTRAIESRAAENREQQEQTTKRLHEQLSEKSKRAP